jgi:hypothetical protein
LCSEQHTFSQLNNSYDKTRLSIKGQNFQPD